MDKQIEETSPDPKGMNQHELPTAKKPPRGGLITMPFIIANEALERVASYGLLPNMILYLIGDYKLGVAKGTNILFFWSALTNFMPLFGAFLSDSYLGRFRTIGFGSIASFTGMVLLWLTAVIPQSKPPPCNQSTTDTCKSASTAQLAILFSSFVLMSIGAGGIRACSLAFGADQLDKRGDPKNERVLESFFNWYYASASFSVLIALTGIVYIQDHMGWKVGFGVPAMLMFFSGLLFFLASRFYIKQKASKSLFTGLAQVLVASYKNRRLALPPRHSDGGWYHHMRGSSLVVPSNKLRFLNKACIIRNPEEDISEEGLASDPWSLCTTEQVEELKALIKVMPIWSTGAIMSISVSQNSFPVLQANSMDRHLTSSFKIPAGSFGMFATITLTTWIPLYDRVILPLASKITGKQVRLGVKQRMGIGIFLSCISMAVSAIVENIRRKKAISQGFFNNPHGVVDMTAFWLVPQYCLIGLAEAFNAIGQTEFYYTEFPKSMSSVAAALFGVGMGAASLLASVIVSTVDGLTKRGGKESWVSSNINKGHYENYYWILAIMGFLNLLYYFVCSWAYGPCVEEESSKLREGKGLEEELIM